MFSQWLLKLAATIAAAGFLNVSVAQHSRPDTISATGFSSEIVFDGLLNDSVWQMAAKISNFTQCELNYCQPSEERTEVAILYNKYALHIGVWCYQKHAEKIIAKFMQRDFDYSTDDNFQVIISPFNDRRNGYLFVINPLGARADVLVSGGEEGNMDWNGVWNAKTSIDSAGWFAEIIIPFSTLQFKRDSVHHWAINFERDIRSTNERSLWQGWSRDYSIFSVVNAGTLAGIKNIGYAKRFEFKPYGLGGFEYNKPGYNYPAKIGADLNVNITPTLKLNLTANTDFAQVEADRIAVNLTRFNLYYPEKRQFFLEGYNQYQFYLGNQNDVFYTRSIGIENLQSVPVIAGARMFGKEGKNNIGVLSIQTGKKDSVPPTNNTVLRYKRDISAQSYIGCIVTNKINSQRSSQVIGIDGSYTTAKFLRKKNLVISGNIAQSLSDLKQKNNSLAYRFFIDYPNDIVDMFAAVSAIGENFNPELGFLTRKNYEAVNWNFRYTPRIFTRYGIRKMLFKPWEATLYRTQSTGEIESFYNESRPLGFAFKSGESFEFNLQQSYDRLDADFDVTDSISVPVGKYWMNRAEVMFSTFQARRLWASVSYNRGTFYTGTIQNFESSLGINFGKHLNVKTDYIYNLVSLPQGKIVTSELANYITYSFNTNLDVSLFSQWNSLNDIMRFNFRLHWIPTIGSDLYVVYNQGYEQLKQIDLLRPQTVAGVAKLVYRFTF
jgi:hypothetical protein